MTLSAIIMYFALLFAFNAVILLMWGIIDRILSSDPTPKITKTNRYFHLAYLNAIMSLGFAAQPLSLGRFIAVMVLGVSLNLIGIIETRVAAKLRKDGGDSLSA